MRDYIADILRKRNVDVKTEIAIIGGANIIMYLILLHFFTKESSSGMIAAQFIFFILVYTGDMLGLRRYLLRKDK